MTAEMKKKIEEGGSVFTGGFFASLGITLVTWLVSTITLGIATPWLTCWKESWYAENTFIDGKQMQFDGTGGQLFGSWIKWWLLSVVTLGIFALWIPIKYEQWRVKHIHFVDVKKGSSEYTPAPKTVVKACPVCHAELDKDVKFCRMCGAVVGDDNKYFPPSPTPTPAPSPVPKSERKAICPHCGARQSEDNIKCKYCGTFMH